MTKKPSNKIMILGIGNILYSDEGIGVHCIPSLHQYFADDETVIVEDGATDGMMLLPFIEETDHLIIIDAINANQEPGTLIKLEDEDIPKYTNVKLSIHQLGFKEVLAVAQIREKYPKHVVMVGMQPFSLKLNPEITSEAKTVAPKIIEAVIKQVEAWRNEHNGT